MTNQCTKLKVAMINHYKDIKDYKNVEIWVVWGGYRNITIRHPIQLYRFRVILSYLNSLI